MADPQNQVSEDEEFAFRARAEQEARARQQASQTNETPNTEAGSSQQDLTTGQKIIGGLQTAGQVVGENWAPISGVAGSGIGLYKGAQAINAYKEASNTKLYGDMLNNYSKLNHDIRQYEKMGKVPPQELLDARARLGPQLEVAQSKLPGYNPNVKAPAVAPTATGPVNPATAPGRIEPTMGAQTAQGAAQGVRTAAPAAAQGEGLMSRFGQLASKYGSAIAESPIGKVGGAILNNPITRFAASAPVQGAMLALHSGGLNQGEEQQLARIRAVQDTINKLPKDQQSFYFTLPFNKKQQVDQMIMSGQNPSALLVPNAINSGFDQQLSNLGR